MREREPYNLIQTPDNLHLSGEGRGGQQNRAGSLTMYNIPSSGQH